MTQKSIDRRDFLRLSVGAGSLAVMGLDGAFLAPGSLSASSISGSSPERIGRVGVQLYTVRSAFIQAPDNMELESRRRSPEEAGEA
jgi:hypothetical protein